MRTSARYGLSASRVGEASHPGPPLTRLRRMGRLLNLVEVSSESESQEPGTRNQIVSPPWVDMRRGDEGEVSTVPAESVVLREMDRHHVEETCVDQETPPQDVVTALEFDLRHNVGDEPTPRPATRRRVLVRVSSDVPQSMNEQDTQ